MPSKFSRCAEPPMTLCSTVQQPRKPKSCSRDGSMGEAAPASTLRSKAASITSLARLLSVATVVGYLHICFDRADCHEKQHCQNHSRGKPAPASTLRSQAASITSLARLLSVATVVGCLQNTWAELRSCSERRHLQC